MVSFTKESMEKQYVSGSIVDLEVMHTFLEISNLRRGTLYKKVRNMHHLFVTCILEMSNEWEEPLANRK